MCIKLVTWKLLPRLKNGVRDWVGKLPDQVTNHNIIRRMRIACRIPKATHTDTHKHTLRITNTYCFSTTIMAARTRPQCYVIRKLAVLFFSKTTSTASAPSAPAPASSSVATVVFPRGRGAGRGVTANQHLVPTLKWMEPYFYCPYTPPSREQGKLNIL